MKNYKQIVEKLDAICDMVDHYQNYAEYAKNKLKIIDEIEEINKLLAADFLDGVEQAQKINELVKAFL